MVTSTEAAAGASWPPARAQPFIPASADIVDLRVGMKIYDNAWFLKHELEPEAAADVLSAMGVTFVLAQSKLLPMQDTAVESAVRQEDADRFARLDDRAFRDALRNRRIGYFASLNIGFDPAFIGAHPELLPVDQFGRTEAKVDWYLALPPDRRQNILHKIALLERAVRELEPDGVHLGFIRWPGFWETWLPDVERAVIPDYCYAKDTLTRFCEAKQVDLPTSDPSAAAREIRARHRRQWRDWKCEVTRDAVGSIRAAIAAIRPGVKIAINTLPFFPSDFDNAVEEVAGQSPAVLRDVADIFEVMAYHQILKRDEAWPAAVAANIKARSGRATVCTLQGAALYLDGMHAGRGRAEHIGLEVFLRAVNLVEATDVDGICVFTFTDFLGMRGTDEGERRIARLRAFRR